MQIEAKLIANAPNNIKWRHTNFWRNLILLSLLSICYFAAEALNKVKNQNVSDAFRDLFLPNGQAPLSGLFTRRLDLAAILDAVADKGISEFYTGDLAKEMVAAVRENYLTLIISASY